MAFGENFLRDTSGSPGQARCLHPVRSGSQSQHSIWVILPTCRASHIIKIYTLHLVQWQQRNLLVTINPLEGILVHCKFLPLSPHPPTPLLIATTICQNPCIHLGEKRHPGRKYLAHEHNSMIVTSTQIQTT